MIANVHNTTCSMNTAEVYEEKLNIEMLSISWGTKHVSHRRRAIAQGWLIGHWNILLECFCAMMTYEAGTICANNTRACRAIERAIAGVSLRMVRNDRSDWGRK